MSSQATSDKSLYLKKMDKSAFQVLETGSDNPKDETAYWLSKPVIDRFIALELLRQRCYNYDSSTSRLQRVFSITELKKMTKSNPNYNSKF